MRGRPRLARADRQQNFLAEGILELFELERRFTLVAQHFQDGRPAFLGDLNAAVFEVDDVHLEGLDLKVPVIPAVWTGQRQNPCLPGVAIRDALIG